MTRLTTKTINYYSLQPCLGPDYMVNFVTNPLKTKLSITWRRIQPGLKILALYSQTGLGFSAQPNGLKNPCNRYHFFNPG